jgi:hypothetical protein
MSIVCIHRLKTAFLPAVLPILFLAACGEMDTILPSSVTYQVSAIVGETTLENCSVIGKDDTVQPVFVDSVVNDPDLTGLLVYLRDSEGERTGRKVYYLLKNAENPVWEDVPEQSPAGEGPENEENQEGGKETGNSVTGSEIFIPVSRLDRHLPAFPFPENLEIGNYFLVFEALGGKQTLYRTERHVYYIGDAKFALDDIQSYFPWISAGTYLIPPGLAVMLEAQVSADERLDPYIVWYDGKRRITGGRIADGTDRLLWEAPGQTGFHTIRAEAFPFNPAEVSPGTGNSRTIGRSSLPELRGKVRELALPVSAREGKPGFLASGEEEILHWYRFAGNLRDSLAGNTKDKDLGGNGDLHWVPSEGIYGLSVKTGNTYQLPRLSFAVNKDKEGGGRFFLRVKPVAEGTLFTGSFKAAGSPGNALTMDMVYREKSLQLILESEDSKTAVSLPLDMFLENPSGNSAEYPALRKFIAIEVYFSLQENTFTAAMEIKEDGDLGEGTALSGSFPADPVTVELSGPLSGEISCRLGTGREQAARMAKESRDLGVEKNADEAVPAIPVSLGETAPAEAPTLFPGAARVTSPQREPYPLAIFDELAVIIRKPSGTSGK